jgi:hypothetical protein
MSGYLVAPAPWPRGLPLDRPRPPVPSFNRERVTLELESDAAVDLAAQLAAVHGLLARYWDRDGAEVGLLAVDRADTGPVALRYGLTGSPTLVQARRRAEAALKAAWLPGAERVAPGGVLLAAGDVSRFVAEVTAADMVVAASSEPPWLLTCEYDAELFEPDTIATFLHRCRDLVGRMDREPDARLRDAGWQGPASTPGDEAPQFPRTTLSGQFAAVVRARPDAIALVAQDVEVTYATLDSEASWIAGALQARGVRPGAVVALLSDGSARSASACVGIARAGAVCAVADVRDPPDHLTRVVRDSGAVLAIGSSWHTPPGIPAMDVPCVPGGPQAFREAGEPGAALIVSTDGSTGEVVDVRLDHSSLVSILLDLGARCGAGAGVDWPVRSRVAPDRVLELWAGLLSGAKCILLPADGDHFAAGLPGVSVYRPGALPLPLAAGPDTGREGLPGAPLAGLRLDVLDREGRPVPVGMLGELRAAGLGPIGTAARRRNDGSLQLMTGARPSLRTSWSCGALALIEDALRSHPLVEDVVAVEHHAPGGDSRTVAYVVPVAGLVPDDADDWMPAGRAAPDLVFLAALPRRESGGVDHALLPLSRADAPDAAPVTDLERTLAAIWAEVLGVGRVGRYDNFFTLGGHSLLVMQIESRLRDAFGIDMPRRLLFERPTIAEVAPIIEGLVVARVDQLSDEEVLAAFEARVDDA